MRPIAHFVFGITLVGLLAMQAGCSSTKPRSEKTEASPDDQALLEKLPHQMVEIDRDGNRYTNQPTRVYKVDAHSTLVIEFQKPATQPGTKGPVDTRWGDLNGTLTLLNERATEWKTLNERKVDRSDSKAVQQLQKDAAGVARKSVDLIEDLESLGVKGDKVAAVLSGRTLGYTNRARTPYLNLAEWATNNWTELKSRVERLQKEIEANSKYNVTVQAARKTATGKQSLLHIPQWDDLPSGVYSPIDRTGLRPTEAERERLEAARAAAEAAAKLINSAITNRDAFKAAFDAKVDEWMNKVEKIQVQFEGFESKWSAAYPQIITNLDAVAASATPEVKAAVENLKSNLVVVAEIFKTVEQDIATARKIRTILVGGQAEDPLDLLLGSNGLLAAADQFVADSTRLISQIQQVPKRMTEIEASLLVLAPDVRDRVAKLVESELKSSLEELRVKFPSEAEAVATLWAIVRNSLDPLAAINTVANADGKLIAHFSDKLISARLDLNYAGLSLDDRVTLTLQATNPVTGLLSSKYENDIGFIGLHGKPAVHLIFVRSLSGSDEATSWKASVAAGVEYHYTFREPETNWRKLWNWLDPGAGVHVASLDQGPDSFEVGTGGTFSLKDGLLSTGLGYNFSIKREYIWIGVDLLTLLNETKKGFNGK